VFNYLELRDSLGSAAGWRGHGDTEVIAALIDRVGFESAVKQLTGHFALAAWDTHERCLWLARDRTGEKPLYVSVQNGTLFVASELRALLATNWFDAKICRRSLHAYLQWGYYPDHVSVLDGVRQIKPGHVAKIAMESLASGQIGSAADIRCDAYWNPAALRAAARGRPFSGTMRDATDEFERRLADIVRKQCLSDVPIGAFLSGGIDSSAVALSMARMGVKPRTFTIAYDEAEYDESKYAARVAAHIGADHTELHVTPRDLLGVFSQLGEILDSPFADQSFVPTYLVSKLARKNVTVALTGDGGDEVFGGYNRHQWLGRMWRLTAGGNPLLRKTLHRVLGAISPSAWSQIGKFGRDNRVGVIGQNLLDSKLGKIRNVLRGASPEEAYLSLVLQWDAPDMVLAEPGQASAPSDMLMPVDGSIAEKAMFWDLTTYMPGDILTKVDRASMANSMETRAPFLDHRLIEWSWSLPESFLIRGKSGKAIVRDMLYRHIPKALFDRPKQGFGIPIAAWLKGPLRAWAGDMLNCRKLAQDGYFNPAPVKAAWDAHVSGQVDRSHALWALIVFQAWEDNFQNRSRMAQFQPAAVAD
jgi:asparagine synthase (glutamine-hydrolysing)